MKIPFGEFRRLRGILLVLTALLPIAISAAESATPSQNTTKVTRSLPAVAAGARGFAAVKIGMTVEGVKAVAGTPTIRSVGKWFYSGFGTIEFSNVGRVIFVRPDEAFKWYGPAVSATGPGNIVSDKEDYVSGYVETNPNIVHVQGYYRKDGTWVAPYIQTAPNGTRNDNFSTKGNTNPYTGEKGTKPRDNAASASAANRQNPLYVAGEGVTRAAYEATSQERENAEQELLRIPSDQH